MHGISNIIVLRTRAYSCPRMDNSKDSFESSDVFWTRSNRRFLSRMAWDEVAMNLHESYRFKTSPPREFVRSQHSTLDAHRVRLTQFNAGLSPKLNKFLKKLFFVFDKALSVINANDDARVQTKSTDRSR